MAKKQDKMDAKNREFEAPEEDMVPTEKKSKKEKKDKGDKEEKSARPEIEDLKAKFLKKRKRVD